MQRRKVEISGINTAELPVLTDREKEELLYKIKAGDKKAEELFIKGNLRLVLSVLQRFWSRGENPDDLFQVGCVGLIKSIRNFDLSLGLKFSTYAVPTVIIRRNSERSNRNDTKNRIKSSDFNTFQKKGNRGDC